MLLKYLIYCFIYLLSLVDYVISLIPGMSNLSTYSTAINTAINNMYGFAHSIMPDTFSIIASYVNLLFGIWITFFVLKTIKRIVPFIKTMN